MALTDKLSAIGEAIRAKTGKSDKLTLDQMPSEIAGITGGGGSDVTLLEGLSFELDFSNGDMPFAAPSGYAVKSAIVKQPATLIPANIKSGVDVAGIVGTLSGGANPDANDPVYYVTFMNGDQVLYVRPVVKGDTCPDVVSKDWVETPTKEPTEQYTYNHNGWSDTDGGTANSSILQNITSDKTVYAAFGSSARTYTITFLDDDGVTVLKTQSYSYGSTPSYEPVKLGYAFVSWTPAIVPVTGDATYTVVWKVQHPEEEDGYVLVLPTTSIAVSSKNGYNSIAYVSAEVEVYEPIQEGLEYKITLNGTAQTVQTSARYVLEFATGTTSTISSRSYPTGVGNPWLVKSSGRTLKTVTPSVSNSGKYFVSHSRTDSATGKSYIYCWFYTANGTDTNMHSLKIQRVL